MANERYKIVNHIEFDTYYIGSPIQIDRGNILLDSATGGLIMQLKLTNISEKTVKAAYLTADYYDVSGEPVQAGEKVNFLGLSCAAGESCGTNMTVKLPSDDIYSVRLHIKKVVFEDDSTADVGGETVTLPKQKKIKSEFVPAAKSLLNDLTEYVPIKLEHNVWLCSCGSVNEGETCVKCHNEKDIVFHSVTASALRTEKERLEKVLEEQERREREEAARIEEENRKKRAELMKKIGKIAAICAVAVLVIVVTITGIVKLISYNKGKEAMSLFESGDYTTAIDMAEELYGDDVPEEIAEYQKNAVITTFNSGDYDAAIKMTNKIYTDDVPEEVTECQKNVVTAAYTNGNSDIAIEMTDKIYGSNIPDDILQLHNNALAAIREEISPFQSKISAGVNHTVGLKSDGTVVAVGYNHYGQCDVLGWTNIAAVSAGYYHTVGLKSNGTVVATGWNTFGECNVSDWTNIVAVSAGQFYTLGLKSDGTVVAVGVEYKCNVSNWSNIVAVSAGYEHTVGLKSDGTVVAVGDNYDGQCNVSGWTDIVAISAGGDYTVGLKSDGTVVVAGDGSNTASWWTNIVALSDHGIVGLKSDRTVFPQSGRDTSTWTDIVAVSAGSSHTAGLKADGTVVAVGDNDFGQCDVFDWDLW